MVSWNIRTFLIIVVKRAMSSKAIPIVTIYKVSFWVFHVVPVFSSAGWELGTCETRSLLPVRPLTPKLLGASASPSNAGFVDQGFTLSPVVPKVSRDSQA